VRNEGMESMLMRSDTLAVGVWLCTTVGLRAEGNPPRRRARDPGLPPR
jgi:hypothetical protein